MQTADFPLTFPFWSNDAKSAIDAPGVLLIVSVEATGLLLIPSVALKRSLDSEEGVVEIGGMWDVRDEGASCGEWEDKGIGDE